MVRILYLIQYNFNYPPQWINFRPPTKKLLLPKLVHQQYLLFIYIYIIFFVSLVVNIQNY
jgi:hypothetical protein